MAISFVSIIYDYCSNNLEVFYLVDVTGAGKKVSYVLSRSLVIDISGMDTVLLLFQKTKNFSLAVSYVAFMDFVTNSAFNEVVEIDLVSFSFLDDEPSVSGFADLLVMAF